MENTTIAVSDKIVLSFAWTGPNIWRGGCSHGGLDILAVDLMFKPKIRTQSWV